MLSWKEESGELNNTSRCQPEGSFLRVEDLLGELCGLKPPPSTPQIESVLNFKYNPFMVEQLSLSYRYNENYPYLKGMVENTGKLQYNLRVGLREYVRVYLPLKLRPGDKLLDVGSCIGTLGHYLKYGGVQTYGLDLNHSAVVTGKKLFGNEKRNISIVADAGHIPFPSAIFNAVVSQDVFEHLNNDCHAEIALREMARVLNPRRDLMFHKITVLEDLDHIHADDSHRIKWPTSEWVRFFEDNGWEIVDNPTRHFPIASNVSYGNFLLQRKN